MNSKSVLGKIMTLLSMENEVEMTYAKLKDGTIVESPTFDVGEPLEVVSEDGTKTPAPDGEHELALRDEEGNETLIKVITKDGKIAERENVELEEKPKEEVVDKDTAETADTEDVKMADATTEEAHPLPNTTDEDPRNSLGEDDEEAEKNDPLISLSYRIDELEKAMKMMVEKMGGESPVEEEAIEEEEPAGAEGVAMAEVEDEELPKLDGAPIDSIAKLSAQTLTPNYGKKIENSQSSFLSKLYR
jgi:hypothetical protein